MRRTRFNPARDRTAGHRLAWLTALVLLASACVSVSSGSTQPSGGDDDDGSTATGATEGGTATGASGPLAEFGESTDADPALVEKALGPVDPSDEASWNIILASIARADQDLDQATIDTAMDCFNNQECDTGTGGEVVMGYADGGGDTVNVWRAVSHMEAILQALTYPEIGTIVSTEANFGGPTFDPTIAENDIRSVFHYVPLHSSPQGLKVGRVAGPIDVTESVSERLLRLPLWLGIEPEQDRVIDGVLSALR